jgi:putative proteasome-type protease
MTYCVGILVQDGLVMIADTRTNAGLDNISTFRKLHVFEQKGERVITLSTAGNLSISQSVVDLVTEGLYNPETNKTEKLMDMPSMFRAAQLVGRAIRHVRTIDAEAMKRDGISFDVSFLVGGQIAGGPLRLFMVYTAGNFIECGSDSPFFQIGEHKYGKPILDRSVNANSDLYDALKISLISMDSTMRSNLGVGLPIDLLVIRRDALETEVVRRIDAGDVYFENLRDRWSAALRAAYMAIPAPNYHKENG